VQLGITGLCVYEVDKEVAKEDSANENLRLRRRIAELESVVRGLKNSPHPRWAATGVPTEELHRMYRRRNRDPDGTTTEATSSAASESSDSSPASDDLETLIAIPPPTELQVVSDVQPPSSETLFIPAAPQQPLALPINSQLPQDWCHPLDQSFLLDPSAFAFPVGDWGLSQSLSQSHNDAWTLNSPCAYDDWMMTAQSSFLDQLGPFDWQNFLTF